MDSGGTHVKTLLVTGAVALLSALLGGLITYKVSVKQGEDETQRIDQAELREAYGLSYRLASELTAAREELESGRARNLLRATTGTYPADIDSDPSVLLARLLPDENEQVANAQRAIDRWGGYVAGYIPARGKRYGRRLRPVERRALDRFIHSIKRGERALRHSQPRLAREASIPTS